MSTSISIAGSSGGYKSVQVAGIGTAPLVGASNTIYEDTVTGFKYIFNTVLGAYEQIDGGVSSNNGENLFNYYNFF
jgi:hypothetical protein